MRNGNSGNVSGRGQHSRGPAEARGWARALVFLALAGAAWIAPASAWASQLRVEFDDRSADLVITAFERGSVNDALVSSIVDSPGYALLFDHLAGRTRQMPAQHRAAFRTALEEAVDGTAEPAFALGGVRADAAQYRQTLRELRRVRSSLRWRVLERLNAFLPPVSDFESTAYLVVGGDSAGLAFGWHENIALRLDDFVPRGTEGDLDVDRVASVLTHELFHVGFRAAGGLPPRPAAPDEGWHRLAVRYGPETVGEVWRASGLRHWDAPAIAARLDAWVPPAGWDVLALNEYLAVLSRIQNEGCATYVDAPLRDPGQTRRHEGEIERWMATIDSDWDYLALLTKELTHGAGPIEILQLAERGFDNNGPLYRVGYRMAERIDAFTGRRPFLTTMERGPLDFFATYFETHPYGPGQIDSLTEDEIARVAFQIRAMGEFDPEEN